MISRKSTNAERNAQTTDQQREHTGLRTLDGHLSAREVYHALDCPYPGTDVLDEKRRLRADASSQHAQTSSERATAGATGSGDRAGERGASL